MVDGMIDMNMKVLVLGMVRTNCYIISNSTTKEAIVFDPGDNAKRIEEQLKANDLVCKAILLTHGHFDHIMAAKELSELTKAPIYAHEKEAELLKNPAWNASANIGCEVSLVPDLLLKDQQEINLVGFLIKVIHTPGHTMGGACYYFTDYGILISGDTLFLDSIGRTDLPTGDTRELIKSISTKLMCLDSNVKVYPGHGDPTTIGYERENNIYITQNWDVYDT
ncbi:MBL fold metallo-hydrolase [Variimorphobacter saccharofermentans]|nr:MBL fold metallo-hydrolase [Variimorphobacter saccharofermentans]